MPTSDNNSAATGIGVADSVGWWKEPTKDQWYAFVAAWLGWTLEHQGAIWGGLVAPIIAYFATVWGLGYAIPMMIGTMVFASSYIAALWLGPETKGKELVADLVVA